MTVPRLSSAPSRRDRFQAGLARDVDGFTPEITLSDGGPAGALASVVSRAADILYESLDRLPLRSRLAFADFCANAVQPATPARVPMVLSLLDTIETGVVLPEGSRFAARLPPPPPTLSEAAAANAPTEVEFATDGTITLSPGALAACYSINPGGDTFADHVQSVTPGPDETPPPGTSFFTGFVQAPHELLIGHDADLALKGQAEIRVSLDFLSLTRTVATRPILLDWSYLSEEGWFPLVTARDTTNRLTRDGEITLRKDCGPDAVEGEVDGRSSYWLRAVVSDRRPRAPGRRRFGGEVSDPLNFLTEDGRDFLPGDRVTLDGQRTATVVTATAEVIRTDIALPAPPEGRANSLMTLANPLPPLRPAGLDTEGALPTIDRLHLSVGFRASGLQPDVLVLDNRVLDMDRPFLPLGDEPGPNTTLFLSCEEAFDKASADIEIRAEHIQTGDVKDDPLTIEAAYWNGTAWIALKGSDKLRGVEDLFGHPADDIPPDPLMGFRCPDDWEKSEVNGEEKLWLRLRIVTGHFGVRTFERFEDDTDGTISVLPKDGALVPPIFEAMRLAYIFRSERSAPDHCVTYNDFTHTDRSFEVRWHQQPFTPFEPVSDRAPALHFGFTAKPPVGMVSLLVTVPGAGNPAIEPRPFVFEYRTAAGWRELAVLDETEGFSRSGLLQFVGPEDAVAVPGLGGTLWRVRARFKSGISMAARQVSGVFLNGVWATQMAGVRRNVVGASDGTADQLFVAPPATTPVLPGAEIEVREWTGRGDDWTTVVAGVPPEDLRFELDPVDGATPIALWVRWHIRPNLAWSGPEDRHILMDPATGYIRTGGNGRGRVVPARAEVSMAWRFGGGLVGNVPTEAVNEVRSIAPGISGARNPVPADGAAAEETQSRLLDRAAARLAHGFRAVNALNYADLAREATPEVARAVARAVTGPAGTVQRGRVELVLVPQSLDPRPMPGQTLRARVEGHLAERVPAGIARGVRLVSPEYTNVAVIVRAQLSGGERAGRVEDRIRAALDGYLHALSGGAAAEGWPFGATIRLSHIAERIAGVTEVTAIEHLRWAADGALAPETLVMPSDHLPAPGGHQITLSLEAER